MSHCLRAAACLSILIGLTGQAAAQVPTASRYVEFRDGSVIRLQLVDEPLKFLVVRPTGRVETLPVLPSAIKSLVLAEDGDFGKRRQLLSAVQQLAAESFAV